MCIESLNDTTNDTPQYRHVTDPVSVSVSVSVSQYGEAMYLFYSTCYDSANIIKKLLDEGGLAS